MIASKIINLTNEKYEVFVLTESGTSKDKVDYYLKRMKKKSNIHYFNLGKNRISNIFRLSLYIKRVFKKKFDAIFLASIDNSYYHYLLSRLCYDRIFTFDDGIANIIENGPYESKKDSLVLNLFRFFLFVRVTLEYIKENSSLHYTIYKDKNIFAKTYYIRLFDEIGGGEVIDVNRKVKIFLGQPIYEHDAEKSKEINQRVVMKLEDCKYYPHPRDSFFLTDVDVIESQLIFEEYLLVALKENRDTEFEIYSFFSTVLVNLRSVERVKLYSVDVNDAYFSKYYNKIKAMGVDIIDIESL